MLYTFNRCIRSFTRELNAHAGTCFSMSGLTDCIFSSDLLHVTTLLLEDIVIECYRHEESLHSGDRLSILFTVPSTA